MRGRSYTPSPPRGYGRRGRSPSPRMRGGRDRDLPTSLLVRNLRHDCRPEDLRRPFEQFGALKDIYLPRDYYSGEPRGFGFIQYVDPIDAAEAKHHMDGYLLLGREVTVVFAEENRKKPTDMRARERVPARGRDRDRDRRRSPPRYSRSPPPRSRHGTRSQSRDYYSPQPKRRHQSRSLSPKEVRYSRERSYQSRERSISPRASSPVGDGYRSRSKVVSPRQSMSPSPRKKRSVSPRQSRSPSPLPARSVSRSRSQSLNREEYARERIDDRSPSR